MKKSKFTSAVILALLGLSALHAETKIAATPTGKGTPKYVFVFVGDGMSYPQIQRQLTTQVKMLQALLTL